MSKNKQTFTTSIWVANDKNGWQWFYHGEPTLNLESNEWDGANSEDGFRDFMGIDRLDLGEDWKKSKRKINIKRALEIEMEEN